MRWFSDLPLRTRLIITSLAISIIPLALVSLVAGVATRQALVGAANQSLAGAAAQTAAEVDGFIQSNLDAVRTEAQLPDFGEYLDLREAPPPAGGGEMTAKAAHLSAILRALSRRDQLYILSYALLDRSGIEVMGTGSYDVGADRSSRDYFHVPLTTGLPYASPVQFGGASSPPVIYFSAPVRNPGGNVVGVLWVRYNAAALQQIIARTRNRAGAESFAVPMDENHVRLADSLTPDLIGTTVVPLEPARVAELQAAGRLPPRPAEQLSTDLAALEQGLSNSAAQPSFQAEMHPSQADVEAVAVAPMTTQPWLVAFGQSRAIFLAPVERQSRNSLAIAALVAILVALAAAGGAQLLTRPIARLTAVAQRVGAGDLNARARAETGDEIGTLARTFNAMTAQLRQTLEGLAERSAELQRANERLQAELIERQRGEVALRESEAKYRALVDEVNDGFYISDPNGVLTFANRALAHILGFTDPGALIGRRFEVFVPPGNAGEAADQFRLGMAAGNAPKVVMTEVVRQDGTCAFVEIKPQVVLEGGRAVGSRGILRDITERKRAEEEIRRRLAELEAVNELSTAMRAARTLDEMLPVVLKVTLGVMRADAGSIWLYNPAADEVRIAVARGWGEVGGELRVPPEKPGQGLAGYVFASRQALVERDYHLSPRLPESVRQRIPPGTGGAAVPLRAADMVIGVFDVTVPGPRELTPDEVHLLTILCEIAGNAIQRIGLHEQTEQRLQRLVALHRIDAAISASLDLRLTLNVFVDQVMAQLRVDAAAVMLLKPGTQTLEHEAGRGFRTRAIERTRQRLGEGNTGRVALERRTLHVADLREAAREPLHPDPLTAEGFIAYFGVPLIAKGEVKGVLEVFHRAPLEPDEEWLDFLETLAGQAAIAIDDAQLFADLQRSNADLTLAYDATIEGWSRALDLRDQETEGHTRRVAEMTVRLARAMGMNEWEMVHLRRGALLHDIGKMGIPDSVLLKPGPLTDEEWAVMRRHPEYAYDMLSPIAYLRPALDIPCHHHEKWNGTGYPRGLRGEQIPLAARLFAVVDVWDALRSDRPYRVAWPAETVREYIRSLAGIHFDPLVVKVFLETRVFESG